MDGVSFDIRRGEVFCLVGESGCGKTTTGKALLRLEDATEGDVFFEMPDEEYSRYTESLTSSQTPDSGKAVDELRRKYSLTWEENQRWTAPQVLLLGGMLTAATVLAFLLPSLAMGLSALPLSGPWPIFGFGVAIGVLLGGIGPLRPARVWRRTPAVLALLATAAVFLAPILSFYLHDFLQPTAALRYSPFDAFSYAWSTNAFAMLLILIVAPSVAGALSRTILSLRQRREGLSGIKMRTLRRRLHLIFQDPYESLNPKQSIYEIVAEPLRVNRIVRNPEEAASRVAESLSDAGLRPPEEFMFRFPHEVSGGQRQRISIAAALVLEPDFIVADEPVSMLDVSIRTEILQLMMDLRETRGLTYLFITHDLSLAWVLADRIAVMYLGQIVEIGTTEQVIRNPKHPYTQALMSVVPSPNPRHRAQRMILKGERPDPVNIPTGCRFHPRCPMAFARCGWNASEVLEDLHGAAPKPLKGLWEEAIASDPRTIRFRPKTGTSADTLAEELRRLVADKKDQHLAFRGVADISPNGGSVTVTVHSWTEPPLLEIAPGNSVACLLVNPPAEQPTPALAT
ncbi:MAG TPA: oligopeptide/dipeptide ABC transporter ATP-binding protein [Thermoplasmata archaeon]|nr:oligopeptide/dipeptide ABC transporter ATP-binding protein [Thermoplasmata archaeon]